MDCKVWMADGQAVMVMNIKNVKPFSVDTESRGIAVYGPDDENTHPIAQFYGVLGYEITGRK